jgi:hypothetical protein
MKIFKRFTLSVLFLLPSISFAFVGGSGAEDNPYQISTCAELQSIHSNISLSYILVNDIDCNGFDFGDGRGFMPLGNGNHFTGTLDGNDYTIFNLKIDRPGLRYTGLVAYLAQVGTIKNISVSNGSVTGGDYTGGLVGYISGASSSTMVTNLSYHGDVKGAGYVGGIVGAFYNRTISHSKAVANVSASGGIVGGFAGYLSSSDVSDNHVVCTVTSTLSQAATMGGFAGFHGGGTFERNFADCEVHGYRSVGGLLGEASYSDIIDSYALGQVTANTNVGGLIGNSSSQYNTTTNSFSAAKVTGVSYVGGLIGYNFGNGVVTNSYWDKERSGQAVSGGGTPKTTAEMYQQATYVGWNFNSTWQIDEGVNYPHFINVAKE